MAWGEEEEQAAEINAGNRNAKNWQLEAEQIVEAMVRPCRHPINIPDTASKMDEYYSQDFTPLASEAPTPTPDETAANVDGDSDEPNDFDRHCQKLVSGAIGNEGWREELAHYLNDIPNDVTKDTDIVEWWGVCILFIILSL
jgi:hypothetical protein